MNRGFAALITLALLGSLAGAVQYNSFKTADIHGVTVTSSADGLVYEVALGLDASMTVDGRDYAVTGIAGFYALHGSSDLGLDAAGSNVLSGGKPAWVWNYATEGGGEAAGWEARSNANRLNAGSSISLAFDALNAAQIDGFGFHLVFAPTIDGANTGFYRQDAGVPPVPEPVSFSLIGLGIGFTAMLGKRRKR